MRAKKNFDPLTLKAVQYFILSLCTLSFFGMIKLVFIVKRRDWQHKFYQFRVPESYTFIIF